MSTPAPLVTVGWWRLLLERLGRQAAQTAVPLIGAIVTAGGQVDVQTVSIGVAGALAVSLGKALFLAFVDVEAPADAPLWVQVLDRAVPAAAGVLAGLWPLGANGFLTFAWGPALLAAGSAAVVAVVAVYATPAALTRRAVPSPEHAA